VLGFSGSRIVFKMNSGTALGMTDSVGLTVLGAHFVGFNPTDDLEEADLDDGLIPDVGILCPEMSALIRHPRALRIGIFSMMSG
jgi:hypothetical protein